MRNLDNTPPSDLMEEYMGLGYTESEAWLAAAIAYEEAGFQTIPTLCFSRALLAELHDNK